MAAWREILLFSVLIFDLYVIGAAPKKNYVGVVGGETAPIEDFPYQVSVKVKNKHICGGTIIHEQFILTAAHCTTKHTLLYSLYSVRAGTAYLEEGGTPYEVENIIVHYEYDYGVDYDLSILKLKNSLELSDKVAIAKLSTLQNDFEQGTVFNITGWGNTEYGGAMSNILLRTEVPLVEQGTCKNDYEYLIDVNDRMLCAGTDRHDACQGDSGGPLSLHGEVVAVVSISTYCALKEYPTIYMKVSKFHSWIKNTIDRHL